MIANSVTNVGNDVRKLETLSNPPSLKTTQSTSIVKVGLIYRHHGELGQRHLRMIS